MGVLLHTLLDMMLTMVDHELSVILKPKFGNSCYALKKALLYPPLPPTLYNDELSSLEIAVTCVQNCRWSGGKDGRYSLDHSGLPPKLQIHPETSVHHC